jgi:transposase-like protein
LVLGNEKNQVTMQVIRYRKGFKMQCVREVEAGRSCAFAVQRKYKIKGTATVMRWVRQLGSGRYGKIIRVEKAHEVNEAGQLRSELRRVKEALADTHMELALEQAFLAVACEELDQSLESFKKKHAGGRRTRRSRPTRS